MVYALLLRTMSIELIITETQVESEVIASSSSKNIWFLVDGKNIVLKYVCCPQHKIPV